ncbi:hypothetical protein PC119_g5050 [Phytophthora cactorum]|nr:hypothetical protein PC119_g5050 [Phytophthora cactorum]
MVSIYVVNDTVVTTDTEVTNADEDGGEQDEFTDAEAMDKTFSARNWNPDKTLLESADATQILFSFDQIWRLLSSV